MKNNFNKIDILIKELNDLINVNLFVFYDISNSSLRW